LTSFGGVSRRWHPANGHRAGTTPNLGQNSDLANDRHLKGGAPFGFRASVRLVKGDWQEFSTTLGFVSWSNNNFPCMYCHCNKENQFDFAGANFLGDSTWGEVGADTYDAACRACEVSVRIDSKDQHRQLRALLFFDRRKKGSCGRALKRGYPLLGLEAGDRLEPSPELPDVAGFDALDTFPVTVLFWRPASQTRVRRRNPLFSPGTYITLDCFGIDVLHTLHLGVIMSFISHTLWACVEHNVFEVRGSAEEIVAVTVAKLRVRLAQHYDAHDSEHPEHPKCRLTDFSTKTLCGKGQCRLQAKAAETGHMLSFAVELLQAFAAKIVQGESLKAAGLMLSEYMDLLRDADEVLPPAVAQRLFDLSVRHVRLMQRLGYHLLPKHHLWIHMNIRSRILGNPRSYGTFLDESANGQMAQIAQSNHRIAWARKTYWKFRARFAGGVVPLVICMRVYFTYIYIYIYIYIYVVWKWR
jgi:hypothetical protein